MKIDCLGDWGYASTSGLMALAPEGTACQFVLSSLRAGIFIGQLKKYSDIKRISNFGRVVGWG